MLGASHWCGGARQSASGRCTPGGARPRSACGRGTARRGSTFGLGGGHLPCGDSHCAWGARYLHVGVEHSL